MLKSIFYARFHPDRGPSVLHQYPPPALPSTTAAAASIASPTVPSSLPTFSFSQISTYVIPPYELCNRALSIRAPCTSPSAVGTGTGAGETTYDRVLGFPISLEDAKYARNRFTFNVCFVLDGDASAPTSKQTAVWQGVVRKTACFFRSLEEDDGGLAKEEGIEGLKWAGEEGYPAVGKGMVFVLLQRIWEDLNGFGECCVRVSRGQVLNLRLEVVREGSGEEDKRRSTRVQAWDVPVLIRRPPAEEEWTWDLVLKAVFPFVDGVNHVSRIAELADVEPRLVKRAVRELVLHDTAVVMPIFHFQAVYALKEEFAHFACDEELVEECRRYVAVPPRDGLLGEQQHERWMQDGESDLSAIPTASSIIQLYASLRPGIPLADFCLAHASDLRNVDVRRLVTFGLLKRFLRRVHKYVLVEETPHHNLHHHRPSKDAGDSSKRPALAPRSSTVRSTAENAVRAMDKAWKRAALSSGWATPPAEAPILSMQDDEENGTVVDEGFRWQGDAEIRKYLDGKHCLDQVCVELKMGEKRALARLREEAGGEVVVLCR